MLATWAIMGYHRQFTCHPQEISFTQRSTKKLDLWLVRELTAPLPTLWFLTWPEGREEVGPRAFWEHSTSAFSMWTLELALFY